MKKVIKACFMVFAFLAAIVVFAPKTFARPVPVIADPDNYVEVSSLTIEGNSTVLVANSIQLTAVVKPTNATINVVKWSSLNPDVASVDSQGKVTGQSNGTARIKATIYDVNNVVTAYKLITVNNKVSVESVSVIGADYLELKVGQTERLVSRVLPVDASNQSVRWSSSNTQVAGVTQNGHIQARSSGVATITVTTVDGHKQDSINVYVNESAPEWTIMIYMCSPENKKERYGAALNDVNEMLKVNNQPSKVNVIVQTGGNDGFHDDTHTIETNSRYHIRNGKFILDERIADYDMGESSSFANFLRWGLKKYPAKKTGVIIYGHGSGMMGFGDGLLNSEVNSALKTVFDAKQYEDSFRLEFIAYNSCLMAVQDIADFNARYFKYMVATQELLYDSGFRYDTWLDDVYSYKDTKTILKAIVEGYDDDSSLINYDPKENEIRNIQTMSVLDLSKMKNYREKFEAMLKRITNYSDLNFSAWMTEKNKQGEYYTKRIGYGVYDRYGLFDAESFIQRVADDPKYSPDLLLFGIHEVTNPVKDALHEVVLYTQSNKSRGSGLSVFFSTGYYCPASAYTSQETNFSNWRNIVQRRGWN